MDVKKSQYLSCSPHTFPLLPVVQKWESIVMLLFTHQSKISESLHPIYEICLLWSRIGGDDRGSWWGFWHCSKYIYRLLLTPRYVLRSNSGRCTILIIPHVKGFWQILDPGSWGTRLKLKRLMSEIFVYILCTYGSNSMKGSSCECQYQKIPCD